MGEPIDKDSELELSMNERMTLVDEEGKPILIIRRFRKGAIHIDLKYEARAYTYGSYPSKGAKKIRIYPTKKGD